MHPKKLSIMFSDKELTAVLLAASNYTGSDRSFDNAQATAARKIGLERRRRANINKEAQSGNSNRSTR